MSTPTEPLLPSPRGSWWTRLRRLLVGAPRDLQDGSIYRHLSLIALLAWVGLGADGLSSSAYGPEEAWKALGEHTYLAVALAVVTASTVLIISAAYSRIIEAFPHGGGGYVVATKLLGRRAGVVSGSALLVDYVLTITISIAAAGDALFSLLPGSLHGWKEGVEVVFILFLTVLNLRGVRESVLVLTPVFVLFLLTHLVLIGGGVALHLPAIPETARQVQGGFSEGVATLGLGALVLRFIHAYSLGGGTYTGIEAVSNGLPILREPRVQTARRTMILMGFSLSFTASGLLLCYLLWGVSPVEGKTMNAVLAEAFGAHTGLGRPFVVVTLLAEGALLVVAAQAGFVDGPRVLANMAVDSWVPRRFSALSDRLTIHNGILLMGGAALVALFYTSGRVDRLVVMYSINVFVTFSLSMLGMFLTTVRYRKARWIRRAALFLLGLALCGTILAVTIVEKFAEGAWVTLAVTGTLIALCFVIRSHYEDVRTKLDALYESLVHVRGREAAPASPDPDPGLPTAVVLVGGYGGLGIHTFLNVFRSFPDYFRGVVFVSIGVVDSSEFKGEGSIEALRCNVHAQLERYVSLSHSHGVPATSRIGIGTDAVEEVERVCLGVAREFPKCVFFAGKVLFGRERWYQRLLHNETAFAIQRRLQWAGRMMVVVPARIR